ncbi:MAG: sulfotransferase domain-containing protein [Planctomycetota bacterium]
MRQHPDIYLSPRKEVHYFSFDANYIQGDDWYHQWFRDRADEVQLGECSTTYALSSVFPDAAARIAAYNPDMKIIYMVRDPLRRISSAWQQLRRFGTNPQIRINGLRPIPDAMWVDNSFEHALRRQSEVLVSSSNYLQELESYRELFPEDRIQVLLFEDFIRDPMATLQRTFRFLDVDPDVPLEESEAHINAYGVARVPRPTLRRFWADARRRRWCGAFGDMVPRRIRHAVSRTLMRIPMEERPQWSGESRRFVLDRLGADSRRFLELYAEGRELWDLEP